MAVSYLLQQALKRRRRSVRRRDVAVFLLCVLLGLWYGSVPLNGHNWGPRLILFLFAMTQVLRDWRWKRELPVSSLDDRAMLEHGVEFERLSEMEQREILRRYRVGTYLMNYFPDEREAVEERDSQVRAYALLRWLLPVIAAIYAVGWWLVPAGRVRVGWTNGPVVVGWLFLLVLALPQMIWMWTEPDAVGESQVVSVAEREA
jgi:hypothetical protein